MTEQGMRFRIGLFVLLSLVLLATLVTLFGSLPSLFKQYHEYVVTFADAPGVNVGTPVRRSGVRIGEVKSVDLDHDTGEVRVGLLVERPYKLHKNEQPVLVQGLLPLVMDAADYRIVSPSAALQVVVGAPAGPGAPTASPAAGAPAVQLTKVELVYVLVPAGDHSYYEPAYLFSGSVKTGGTTVPRNVLVPAVDPSQRTARS